MQKFSTCAARETNLTDEFCLQKSGLIHLKDSIMCEADDTYRTILYKRASQEFHGVAEKDMWLIRENTFQSATLRYIRDHSSQ